MSLALTAANNFLKENYTDSSLRYAMYEKWPLLAMLRKTAKKTMLNGRYHFQPHGTAPAGGFSQDFATAKAVGQANQFGNVQAFEVPAVSYYGYQSIPGLTWAQAESDMGSFITMFDKAVKDSVHGLEQDLAKQLYKDGYMDIGQVGAITTTNVSNDTIVLTSNADCVGFYEKQGIVTAANRTNGTPRSLGSGVTTTGMAILAVQRGQGKLVFNQAVTDATNGIPNIAVGDWIFKVGNSKTVGGTVQTGLVGLEGWCPASVPSSTLFYNVDRSQSDFYYGTSYDGNGGGSLVNVIKDALARSRNNLNGECDTMLMGVGAYNTLEKQLASANRYQNPEVIQRPIVAAQDVGEDAFVKGIKLGDVLCVMDPACPNNRIFGIKEDELEYLVLNDGFTPWSLDGLTVVREDGNDAIGMRFAAYHAVVANPKNLINIQISPISV